MAKVYVDDVNVCLKKSDIQCFHNHLNSVDQHIQFTSETPSFSDEGENISFLDTSCRMCPEDNTEVTVHRKATHTNKYLAFDSHNPAEHKSHKRAVVISLMNRASDIPSNICEKEKEKRGSCVA